MKQQNLPRTALYLFQSFMLAISIGVFLQLWDSWMISDGPHGAYRWIGMDFAPYWTSVREMFSGANPYTPENTLKIQDTVYGGPANGGDPMMFVYPAYIFLIIAPFALLPFKWAACIYSGILLWACLNFFFILARQWGGENFYKTIAWLLALLFGALPFLVISVTKGQLGYISILALFACRRFWITRPILAGIALSLAATKPTAAAVPIAALLLWALLEKNWKILAGFSASMLILFGSSFIVVGNWIPDYIDMLGVNGGMPVLWSMAILPQPWAFIYAALFIGTAIYAFYISYKTKNDQAFFSATILCGIALFPMRWIYDLYLGILVPSDKKPLTGALAAATNIASLSPWALILVSDSLRGPSAVIALPLIWSAVFWLQLRDTK